MSLKNITKGLGALAIACLLSVACFGTTANAFVVKSHAVDGDWKSYEFTQAQYEEQNPNGHFFTLTSSGTVTISIQSEFYARAYIFSNDNTEREAYDGNAGILGTPESPKTETFKLDLEAGSYFVRVENATTENSYGNYRLKISQDASGANETEPNDSFAKAMELKPNTLKTGFISLDNVCDFYKISIPSDQKILLSVFVFNNAENGLAKGVTVYNSAYEQQGVHHFVASSAGSSVTKEIELKKGIYYLKVDNLDFRQYTGKYQIRWTKAPVKVESIKVSGDKSVNAGKQITLKATVLPADADNKAVTWTSSNPSVATVNSAGIVTGKKIGKATITATSADGTKVTGTYNICVGPKQVSGLKAKAKGNKKVQLRWSKQKGITGIQVQYAKKKTFKGSKKKTVKVSSNATKATVKLKKGTYYVKVRAITKIDGKKYYGDWSKAKKVKIK